MTSIESNPPVPLPLPYPSPPLPLDPSAMKTRRICRIIIKITEKEGRAATLGGYAQVVNALCPVVIAGSAYFLLARNALYPRPASDSTGISPLKFGMTMPELHTPRDYAMAALFWGGIAFILGYSIVSAGKSRALKRADP